MKPLHLLIAGIFTHQTYGTDPVLGIVFGFLAALAYASYLMIMRGVNRGGSEDANAMKSRTTPTASGSHPSGCGMKSGNTA